MIIRNTHKVIFSILVVFCLYACQQPGGNSTGSEYMPDMAHSVAYEANYYNYYYNNTWGSEEEYYEYAKPRKPVPGTVARGSANGDQNSVAFYYGNTEEERTRAMNEIIKNPLPITEAGLKEGKELYNIFCGICHGLNGNGAGYLVRDDGGVYPVQPANLLLDEFVTASNGRYYYSIYHGRNLMGSYKDKLSYNERWNVIHYIRSLQAKDKQLVYNQNENTLNNIEIPAGNMSSQIGMHEDHGNHYNEDGEATDGEGVHGEGLHGVGTHGSDHSQDADRHKGESGHKEDHGQEEHGQEDHGQEEHGQEDHKNHDQDQGEKQDDQKKDH